MTQTLLNNAESGLSNATVATQGSGGNTGSTAGNYFDTLSKGTGTNIEFSTAEVAHGSLSYNFFTTSTSATVSAKWIASITDTPVQAWSRFYLYMPSLPAATQIMSTMSDTSGTAIGSVAITTSGAVRMLNTSGGTISTSTTTLATGAWNRLEYFMISGASTGQTEVKIFTSPDSTTPAETNTSGATQSMNGNDHARVLYGLNVNSTSYSIYMDSIGWSDAGYIGPDVPAVTAAWSTGTVQWG